MNIFTCRYINISKCNKCKFCSWFYCIRFWDFIFESILLTLTGFFASQFPKGLFSNYNLDFYYRTHCKMPNFYFNRYVCQTFLPLGGRSCKQRFYQPRIDFPWCSSNSCRGWSEFGHRTYYQESKWGKTWWYCRYDWTRSSEH